MQLFRRRNLWWPTWLGWLCGVVPVAALAAGWAIWGERYLALTDRVDAEVLIVEGWIGRQGMEVAKGEFEELGYRYVVTGGGLTRSGWVPEGQSYAEMAAVELRRLGVPREKVLVASAGDPDNQRTYETAVAVRRVLEAHGLRGKSVNVLTRGPHARRSLSVFGKVLGPGVQVGVVSWTPPDSSAGPWWRSSQRGKEMLSESVAYLYELLLGSGRWARTNPPP